MEAYASIAFTRRPAGKEDQRSSVPCLPGPARCLYPYQSGRRRGW